MNEGGIANNTPTLVGAASATYVYMGLPLSVWVTIATLAYLGLQIIVILPKAVTTIRKFVRKEPHVESIDDAP